MLEVEYQVLMTYDSSKMWDVRSLTYDIWLMTYYIWLMTGADFEMLEVPRYWKF